MKTKGQSADRKDITPHKFKVGDVVRRVDPQTRKPYEGSLDVVQEVKWYADAWFYVLLPGIMVNEEFLVRAHMDKDEQLLSRFVADLRKMEPTWKAWRLTLTCGINVRRETGELIRLFRMWDERFWNVYVFIKKMGGIRHRDYAHNKLTLKEAIMLVQNYIREINK